MNQTPSLAHPPSTVAFVQLLSFQRKDNTIAKVVWKNNPKALTTGDPPENWQYPAIKNQPSSAAPER
jgi:hypothetical protein